jgi:hypothetical protein
MTESKLTDLNNHLFAQLDRLGKDGISSEDLEQEVSRTSAIVNVSEQIIDNANVSLKAAELVAKHGVGQWEGILPVELKKGQEVVAKKSIPNYSKETIS